MTESDTPPGIASPRAAAHRAALDHVLGLIAEADWSSGLVLRGSAAMLAWAGAAAREPGDLDWIVCERLAVPVDPLDPFPHVRSVETVQQWPEAACGAARYEIWRDEDFDTGGAHPVAAPEGLDWVPEPECREGGPPYADLLERVARQPEATAEAKVGKGSGVRLDAKRAREDYSWGYDYVSGDAALTGARLIIPWRTDDPGLSGELQLDFARDEAMYAPPVLAAIPRADGAPPNVVRAASRELALAWKLLWLHRDCEGAGRPGAGSSSDLSGGSSDRGAKSQGNGRSHGKDLYDAVLLARDPATRLSARLLRSVFRRASCGDFTVDAVRGWDVEWESFREQHPAVDGTAADWLDRLADAVEAMLSADAGRLVPDSRTEPRGSAE